MQGILIVDKPQGWTSFDVVAKLRRVLGTRKIGHSGTLDPMATGVLPVFAGQAARAVDMQADHDKTYEATLLLGSRTDTGDITGQVLESSPVTVGEKELLEVLPRFVGPQMQLPPMYSAVKINGQPLYKAARQGKEVERQPRPVEIYSLRYLGQAGENEYRLEIACSKGTYVRVLLEEIGRAIGVPATMSALRRTRAGIYGLEQSHPLEEILRAGEEGRLESWLLPVDTVFERFSPVTVSPEIEKRLRNGAPTYKFRKPDGVYRLYTAEGFWGLGRVEDHVLRVEKSFCERE
ncbi:MAG: tRNA pseudouridine(55) synthase TruB [Bacteroidales bacterium]|nr:tRNA pseudouridine(55) synthase TruB [Fournierella massiliensis]MCF2556053.1 tRNA pseudouridine(55) synthase TruB [Fournierella massiliensis]MCI6739249.1 tRNA pseudouridine(55) synthase TruB [Bacteroidales bacterium]